MSGQCVGVGSRGSFMPGRTVKDLATLDRYAAASLPPCPAGRGLPGRDLERKNLDHDGTMGAYPPYNRAE
jgi:hypothetical protein